MQSEEGTPIEFGGKTLHCESVGDNSFDDIDIALFSAGGDFSTVWAPKAAAAGCIVVDNSSIFRMDPNCPLVVPEVNPHAVARHKNIIANPNCTTSERCPVRNGFGLDVKALAACMALNSTHTLTWCRHVRSPDERARLSASQGVWRRARGGLNLPGGKRRGPRRHEGA